MNFCRTLTHYSPSPLGLHPQRNSLLVKCPLIFVPKCVSPMSLSRTIPFQRHKKCCRVITGCFSAGQEIIAQESQKVEKIGIATSIKGLDEENGTANAKSEKKEFSVNDSIWSQMVEIGKFSGPALGLWICRPLMSLVDTAVVGQGSSIELAALGPGTVFCDYTSYVFMFLTVATSNLVATALAREDDDEVQHQISILLFFGLSCGVLMTLFIRSFGPSVLTAFTGANNTEIMAAANTYLQIRGLAWPALLVGWVAQSASLGMKDSWRPLKALVVASIINCIGDIVLCRVFGYGIAGAAWATMIAQVVAGFMLIDALNRKGYNGFTLSVPSPSELVQIFMLAAPLFLTMMSKMALYSLLVYYATSMGTQTVAAHQVMIQIYLTCSIWGEPLSQTAQSFMPELLCGTKRNLSKARMLLKSLVMIGAVIGVVLGLAVTLVPWLFPKLFSSDPDVIKEMHKVLIPYYLALSVTPSTQVLEGALLAGRDLKFISSSMTSIFCLGSLLLLVLSSRGYGLTACWFTLVAFQWSRFSVALWRLTSPNGMLYAEDSTQYQLGKVKAA